MTSYCLNVISNIIILIDGDLQTVYSISACDIFARKVGPVDSDVIKTVTVARYLLHGYSSEMVTFEK